MTGVEILATEEVAVAFGFSWPGFWMAFILFAITSSVIGFFALLREYRDEIVSNAVVSILCGILCGVFFGLLCSNIFYPNPTEYETQYKVTIDDSVSMNDFNEKYEIVDQDGRIYTVREKEQ